VVRYCDFPIGAGEGRRTYVSRYPTLFHYEYLFIVFIYLLHQGVSFETAPPHILRWNIGWNIMRARHRLSAVEVKNAPPGKHPDGGGLWLYKKEQTGGSWFLRVVVHGRRREMGLGSIQEVSLKEARETANKARALVRKGKDPIKERERRKRQAAREANTLEQVVNDAFESRKSSLKGDGKPGQWINPLVNHVLPKLGQIPVAEIDQNDIRHTFAPIWHSKSAVAKMAMDRLGICLRHAAALGLDVDLQAVDKAKALLGKSRHVVRHVPAMAWADLPEFFTSLDAGTLTSLAMRFLILTAARSGEVRNLTLDEIHDDVWVIPADRMKAGKEHRVPLSSAARKILEEAKQFERHGHVFVGNRGKPISDMTLSALLKRRGLEARPHGFRTSFRTWCAEATDTPREIAETALAHISGGAVELAYRRTDYLDRRKELMEEWAAYVTSECGPVIDETEP